MATYRAISTGVASALARWEVWNGAAWVAATVLPTVADDVYANGFTVTIDVDFFASSYRNGPLGIGVTTSGTFILNAGITAVGDVVSLSTVGNVVCMTSTGAGNSSVIGNSYNQNTTDFRRHAIVVDSPNFILVGSCYSSGGSSVNVTLTSNALYCNSGSARIVGDVYSFELNNTCCVRSNIQSAVIVEGIAYGGTLALRRACFGCIVIEIRGANENCIVTQKFVMPNTNAPVWTNCKAQTGANVQIEIYDELNQPVLCNPLYAQDQAEPADVRSATVYANGALTGTCAVPPTASVALNVPVDNTVGSLATAAVVAADLLNEMNNSNLTIAQGLRDGMGASAAAIAAVGSINVIP